MSAINYKHLHYFWAVAKAGSITLASQRLFLTPQTISGQLSLFENNLGEPLFNRVGKRLELTDKGKVVLSYADEIFSIGNELEDMLKQPATDRPMRFRVGISDSVPKVIAYRLVEPALREREPLHIICREGSVTNLLGELAVHKLDLVIADSAMPVNVNVRAFNHLLGESGLTFFATQKIAQQIQWQDISSFPQCLHQAPMLLPGVDDAIRPALMRWFEDKRLVPIITGEFDDGALMKAFGQAGVGVFIAPTAIAKQVCDQFNVIALGNTKEVIKRFYAISVERKLSHPAVLAISQAARSELFL
ncbi:MAG: transcriptional activator NhaR [Methylophilus sp.]|nr:transcriptional activator NhaR [Methylophilus sp.]